MEVVDTVVRTLLTEGGIWAALLVIVGWWGWANQKTVNTLQEKRVQDTRMIVESVQEYARSADKTADALLELSRRLERRGDL